MASNKQITYVGIVVSLGVVSSLFVLYPVQRGSPEVSIKPASYDSDHALSAPTSDHATAGRAEVGVADSGSSSAVANSPVPVDDTKWIMQRMTREALVRNQREVYAEFFKASRIPEDDKAMVLELLVDDMMRGLEVDVQGGASDSQRANTNRELLTKLIGESGVRELDETKRQYLKKGRLESLMKMIPGAGEISSESAAAISAALDAYEPSQRVTDRIANKESLSPRSEASLRTEFIKERDEKARQLGKSCSQAETDAFVRWANKEFEERLLFFKRLKGEP